MSPVQPTDLLLINRTGVDYKAPLSQVKDGVLGSHVIQSATAPTTATHPGIVNGTIWVDTSKSPPEAHLWNATPAPGNWAAVGGGGVYSGPTAPPAPTNGMLWVSTASAPPALLIYDAATSSWLAMDAKTPVAPVITSLALSDDAPGGSRFTSQKFTATLTMTEKGTPAATIGLKAWALGSIPLTVESDLVQTVTSTAGPVYSAGGSNAAGQGELTNGFGSSAAILDTVVNWAPLFDGSTSTYAEMQSDPNKKTKTWLMFQTPIPFTGTVELYASGDTTDSSKGWFGGMQSRFNGGGWEVSNSFDVLASQAPTLAPGWRSRLAPTAGTNTFDGIGLFSLDTWPSAGGMKLRYHAIRVDGIILKDNDPAVIITLASAKNYADMTVGTKVTGKTSGAKGLVLSKPGTNQLKIVNVTGTFVTGEALTHSGVNANTKLYANFNGAGAITTLQSADPGWVTMAGASPYKLTFPATFPSGNAPDADLPAGVQLLAEAQASNASGTVTATATAITPA